MSASLLYNLGPVVMIGAIEAIRHAVHNVNMSAWSRSKHAALKDACERPPSETAIEKTVRYASIAFLQLGSQALGYLSALAWCGMTVTPLAVGVAGAATITGLFLIAHRFQDYQDLKQIMIRHTAHAVTIFALSFIMNVCLLKTPTYFNAVQAAWEKAEKVKEEFIPGAQKLISALPEHATTTRFFLNKVLPYFVRNETYNRAMLQAGFGPYKALTICVAPMVAGLGITLSSSFAMAKDCDTYVYGEVERSSKR